MVVDAGVMLELLVGRAEMADALGQGLTGHEHEPLHAPELVEVETLNALRQTVSRALIDEHQATAAVHDLRRARLALYPHAPLLPRIWELRHNLTAYDASYLVLAELLEDSVLVTTDGGLATTARQLLGADRVRRVS